MVKINDSRGKGNDDEVIDLRSAHSHKEREEEIYVSGNDPEFEIGPMNDEAEFGEHRVSASPIREADIAELRTSDNVRVKFDKFASLVAAHANKDLIEQCRDEDVIVSTNLLTDLANANEDGGSKKMPAVFLIGIILGIGLTYLLLKM